MKTSKIKKLGNCFRQNSGGSFSGNVYDPNYIAPTLNCMGGGNTEPIILVEDEREKHGWQEYAEPTKK